MDEPLSPTPGYRLSLAAAGEAWSWRLTTPEGGDLGGLAPDRSAARRSAAFTASAVSALKRTHARRF
ncbi:hypothetical protein [Phenylobacterium sp.]|uniref:hypothetical protein n=1 Tax=Phenylobacterium sp. TaxID=1871053 RepID=UPI0025EEF3A7|nr:hypothetical protein [Phenylobacterium sp.]MBX3483547.1 hypothetical protein [Phenylobacterium sp.]